MIKETEKSHSFMLPISILKTIYLTEQLSALYLGCCFFNIYPICILNFIIFKLRYICFIKQRIQFSFLKIVICVHWFCPKCSFLDFKCEAISRTLTFVYPYDTTPCYLHIVCDKIFIELFRF